MTKEETLSNLKAYLNGDTAIGNIIPLRSVLESVIKYLEPSLPSNLDEAANNYGIDIRLGYPRIMDETDKYIYNAFKAGAEWMSLQSTRTRLAVKSNTPEGKEAYEKVAKEMRASVAAKNYAEGIYCPILKHKNKTGLNCTAVEDAFLKCAEWMAGQGETVDGVFRAGDPGYPDVRMGEQYSIEHILHKPDGIEPGDEVIVQIRKKQ